MEVQPRENERFEEQTNGIMNTKQCHNGRMSVARWSHMGRTLVAHGSHMGRMKTKQWVWTSHVAAHIVNGLLGRNGVVGTMSAASLQSN